MSTHADLTARKRGRWVLAAWAGAFGFAALAEGVPKLEFHQLVYDFGKTSQVETVSGTFRFTNRGDGVLHLEAPQPSCGCTVAGLKPDTLNPGEEGELPFTLSLGRSRAVMEKHIVVRSNDPLTPQVSLAIKVDYTPLYEISPLGLTPNLPLGVAVTNQFATLTRTDGKPVPRLILSPSQPWITATLEPEPRPDATNVQIRVNVRRAGDPRRFSEYLHVYSTDKTNVPVASLFLYGQVMGEVSVSPEALYWSVTDPAQLKAERTPAIIIRRLAIRSTNGREFAIKSAQSTLPGVHVEIVPKEPPTAYELVATLEDVPDQTLSGTVSFETSVPAQARIEVPVIVNVFKP